MTASTSNSTSSNNHGKTTKEGNTLLVALVDASINTNSSKDDPTNNNATASNCSKERYLPVRLTCPHTDQPKDYLLYNDTALLEMQALEDASTPTAKHYSSWFVGKFVVSNGKLHVMTRVDPLFFVLAKTTAPSDTSTAKKSWQPLEQLLGEMQLPAVLQTLLLTGSNGSTTTDGQFQLLHLLDRYEMDEDEIFYKFSPQKALKWLAQKQQRAQTVLLQQLTEATKQKAQEELQSGGAVVAGFTLMDATTSKDTASTNAEVTKAKTKQLELQAQRESIQMVCNYLSESWTDAFLEFQKTTAKDMLTSTTKEVKRLRTADPNVSTTTNTTTMCHTATPTPSSSSFADMNTVTPAPAPAPKLSFGQKQLLKVNKKGMKPMTAFFAAAKKKT